MLSRYTIYRRRPAGAGPLPDGIRQDTRYRTSHILRPKEDIVEAYLADPTDAAWRTFKRRYLALLSGAIPRGPHAVRRACRPCDGQRCVSRVQLSDPEEPHPWPLPHVPGSRVHAEEVPNAQSCDPRNTLGGLADEIQERLGTGSRRCANACALCRIALVDVPRLKRRPGG